MQGQSTTTAMVGDTNEFKLVKSSRRRGGRRKDITATAATTGAATTIEEEESRLLGRILTLEDDVSRLVNKTARILGDHHPAHPDLDTLSIIVYGIGPFSSDRISRRQLSFIYHLSVRLKCRSRVSLFDPILGDSDYSFLSKYLGIERILTNEQCMKRATKRTLFFMPHLDKFLYNNLLWSNWPASDGDPSGSLDKMIIMGNSFSNMMDKTPDRVMGREYPYIHAVVTSCNILKESILNHSTSIGDTDIDDDDTFNDMAIMSFLRVKGGDSDNDIERHRLVQVYSSQEPVYSCLEGEGHHDHTDY